MLLIVQAYYYDEKTLLSNEEFDNLKEDLIWAGSKVAVLRYASNCLSELALSALEHWHRIRSPLEASTLMLRDLNWCLFWQQVSTTSLFRE